MHMRNIPFPIFGILYSTLSISVMVTSQVLGKSHDCPRQWYDWPSASEVTMKDIAKWKWSTTNPCAYFLGSTLCGLEICGFPLILTVIGRGSGNHLRPWKSQQVVASIQVLNENVLEKWAGQEFFFMKREFYENCFPITETLCTLCVANLSQWSSVIGIFL